MSKVDRYKVGNRWIYTIARKDGAVLTQRGDAERTEIPLSEHEKTIVDLCKSMVKSCSKPAAPAPEETPRLKYPIIYTLLECDRNGIPKDVTGQRRHVRFDTIDVPPVVGNKIALSPVAGSKQRAYLPIEIKDVLHVPGKVFYAYAFYIVTPTTRRFRETIENDFGFQYLTVKETEKLYTDNTGRSIYA